MVCKKLAVAPYRAPTVDFNSSFHATTLLDFPSLKMQPPVAASLGLIYFIGGILYAALKS